MLRPEILDGVVQRMSALAEPSRVRLLLRLRDGGANVVTLSKELGIRQASVSKHLGVLREVGLVEARRSGTQSIYTVRDESVFEMCQIVCDGVLRHLHEERAGSGGRRRPAREKAS